MECDGDNNNDRDDNSIVFLFLFLFLWISKLTFDLTLQRRGPSFPHATSPKCIDMTLEAVLIHGYTGTCLENNYL